MEQIETKWDVGTSLIYPGQCYSGFSTSITASTNDKSLSFVLRDERFPESNCPEIMVKFRQTEKYVFFRKKQVWVADIQLKNCNSVYSDCENFVGTAEILKSKYQTIIVLKPEDRKNRLFTLHSKWSLKIRFEYSNQVKGDEIVKFVEGNFGVQLLTKNKK